MSWQFSKASHIGGREEQQDRVSILTSNFYSACILADGVGGHKGGAMAAQILLEECEKLWPPTIPPKIWLEIICQHTHRQIKQQGKAKKISPKTTCVILLVKKNRIYWTHVGDSRLYHIRKNRIIQQSEDHSIAQILLAMGKIRAEQMANHPDKNRLLKSLGGEEKMTIEMHESRIKSGDGLVLCSDGLWESIHTGEFSYALKQADLQQAAEQLVKRAVQRGGEKGDNVSVCLVRYQADNLWEWLAIY
jgi:serine/threonine protein phosphatase PrpC